MLDKLIGANLSSPVEAIGNVLDKLFTSDEERLTKELAIQRLLQKPQIAQIELNNVEAQHRSIFVAGWRPAIGWVCAAALAFATIINPCIQWFVGTSGPQISTGLLMDVMVGMLGLGALRTIEKFGGKTK